MLKKKTFKSQFLIALIYFVSNGLCGYGSSGGYVGYKEGNAWGSPVDGTTGAIYVLEVLRHFLLKIKLT